MRLSLFSSHGRFKMVWNIIGRGLQTLFYFSCACLVWLLRIVGRPLWNMSLRIRGYFRKGRNTRIPRPPGVPFLGNVRDAVGCFGPWAREFLADRHREYGPVYQFTAAFRRVVFLFRHDDIDPLRKADGRFPKHIRFPSLEKYRTDRRLPLGLILSEGDEWRQIRNHVDKMLAKQMALEASVEEICKMADKKAENVSSGRIRRGINLQEIVGAYVSEVFAKVLFGIKKEDGGSRYPNYDDVCKMAELIRENLTEAKKLMGFPPFLAGFHPAYKRHCDRMDVISSFIKSCMRATTERQSKGESISDCVLSNLLKASSINNDLVEVIVTDLFLASVDSTLGATLWLLYELAAHVEIQEQVYAEVVTTISNPRDIADVLLQGLSLLKGSLKESLRLHPVAYFTARETQRPCEIRGYTIPTKCYVAMSTLVMGRDSQVFDRPDEFRPQRWVPDDNRLEKFYRQVPFGFGPRICPGRRIAEKTVLLFVLQFIRRFKLTTTNPGPPTPKYHLFMVPDGVLRLDLRQREAA